MRGSRIRIGRISAVFYLLQIIRYSRIGSLIIIEINLIFDSGCGRRYERLVRSVIGRTGCGRLQGCIESNIPVYEILGHIGVILVLRYLG